MQFRKRRKPTLFYVDLEVNRVVFPMQLVDITPTGAKLTGKHETVDDTTGVIIVRGHELPGTLRWVEGENIGFEFHSPVPPHLYATLAHEKTPAKKRFLLS